MRSICALVLLLTAACVGNIGDGEAVGAAPGQCQAPRAPLRRLTREEYNNTVRDLLGDSSRPADSFPGEEQLDGYENQADVLAVSPLLAEQYLRAAETLAATAVERLEVLHPSCDAAGSTACAHELLRTLGERAFRRPLSDDEWQRLEAVYRFGEASDRATGIRLAIEVMLQSSPFLYRVELDGSEAGPGALKLTSFELASRLSYLLWASMPDDELFAAARDGRLATRADIETQARRMLDDPRARDTLFSFHRQWLGLTRLATLTKEASAFPGYDESLREAWIAQARAFLDSVDTLPALLTASHTFANAELAAFYGWEGATGAELVRVELDREAAAGVLTQAGVMAAYAMPARTSPVERGKLVRERLLCQSLPPPPDTVDTSFPPGADGASVRERLDQHRSDPACAGCHDLMDPIGYGFEQYDGVGRFRGDEDIDTSGEIIAAGDASGSFSGAAELGALLANSDEVASCFVSHYFRFAMGRPADEADSCTLEEISTAFAESGGDVHSLLLAVVTADSFGYRDGGAP